MMRASVVSSGSPRLKLIVSGKLRALSTELDMGVLAIPR
jgi:hypothetical protein